MTSSRSDAIPTNAQPMPNVRMSEIVIAREGETVRSLLGSCIGLAIYDSVRGIGGLAHIVLPASAGHSGPPGKFADTAVPELLRMITALGGRVASVKAKIAGGARMFDTDAELAIGDHNQTAVEQALKARNIVIAGRHCGGRHGRRMMFTPGTGRVRIEIVGHEALEI